MADTPASAKPSALPAATASHLPEPPPAPAVDGSSTTAAAAAGPRKRRRSTETSFPLPLPPGLRVGTSLPGKLGLSSPVKLTAVAEMMEQKRRKLEMEREQPARAPTTPNPRVQALGTLLGAGATGGIGARPTSRPGDAPLVAAPATTPNEPAAAAVAPVVVSTSAGQTAPGAGRFRTSPASTASYGTAASAASTMVTANGPPVASPVPLGDADAPHDAGEDRVSDRASSFSYPDPNASARMAEARRRGMSLPGSGFGRDDSRSPSSSSKKHKCPYCDTEFTRHHNLKSHLLTHSHEKPYLCQTCDSRFRRLHDLKRHMKLHTGERPHICPKCKRRFARGDALARHSKGQGGCAGRRSSAGSFGPGEDGMDVLLYAGEASHEPEAMDDDVGAPPSARSSNVPRIRQHNPPLPLPPSLPLPLPLPPPPPLPPSSPASRSSTGPTPYGRIPSTYPPVAARLPGGLYPPAPGGGAPSSASNGQAPSPHPPYVPHPGLGLHNPSYPPPAGAFGPPGGITESPKPLSPGMGPHPPPSGAHDRSPSLPSHMQQQQQQQQRHQQQGRPYARRARPVIHGATHAGPGPAPSPAFPHLPSLHSLAPDPRYTLPGNAPAPAPAPMHGHSHSHSTHSAAGSLHSGPGSASTHNSLSSGHGQGSGQGVAQLGIVPEERMWAAMRAMEERMQGMQSELEGLRAVVRDLLGGATAGGGGGGGGGAAGGGAGATSRL